MPPSIFGFGLLLIIVLTAYPLNADSAHAWIRDVVRISSGELDA